MSWSQFFLFERSPQAYVDRYIYGKEFSSPAVEFGKLVADGLEEEKTNDPQIEHLRTFLPRYQKKEHEITATFMGVPLLGRMDLFDQKRKVRIGELKTGTVPWNQFKVDKWGQLLFYNLMVFANTGKIAKETHLYWAPTEWKDGKLHLTGEIQTFKANITLKQVILFGSRIPKVWQEIQTVTKHEYKNIT